MNTGEKPPLPYGRSYWVQAGKLMAGFFPGDPDEEEMHRKVNALIDCGVSSIVSLMQERESDYPGSGIEPYQDYFIKRSDERGVENAQWKRFAITDMNVAGKQHISETLSYIDKEIEGGRTVYVHCWMGLGRAGTIVGCWLMRHGYANKENVIDTIKELRADDTASEAASPQTSGQREFVKGWKKGD